MLFGIPHSPQAADNPTLSRQTYKVLQTTQEWLDAGQSTKVVKRLEKLVSETAKRPYDRAIALQSLAHAHIERDDYPAAIPQLKRSIELHVLPDDVQQRARYNLAQLYIATDRFSPAIEQLTQWFKQVQAPKAEAYLLLGSAHLQLNQYNKATNPLRKAIELSEEPKESWYQSLLGAYHELKQHQQSVKLLRKMLKLFPDSPDYWRQLAGIELMRQRYSDALAVMELAYLNGRLSSERDLLNLAQLYSHRNAPYKAAQLLEQEINKGRIKAKRKSWEQTANAWQQAREMERSVSALERALALQRNPELSLRLARLYLEVGRWEAAEKTLRRFLKEKSGKADQTDEAWLLLGIACHEGNSPEAAEQAFSQAIKFSKTRSQAEQWLNFLHNSNS